MILNKTNLDFIKHKSKSHDNMSNGFNYIPIELQKYSCITKNIKHKQINKRREKNMMPPYDVIRTTSY